MKKKTTISLSLALVLILILIVYLFTSCSIERLFQKQSQSNDTVKKEQTASKDSASSGSVKKEETKRQEDYEWWRAIIESRPKGDTVINNVNLYQPPQRVIIEGGKGTINENKNSYDSSWQITLFQMFKEMSDSNSARTERIVQSSKTETKGLGIWSIALLALGYLVIDKILLRLKFGK